MKGNKKGKSKELTQFEIISSFVRFHGHKGAFSSKPPPKRAIFRVAVEAMSLSVSFENGDRRGRYILNEAQATMQIGKVLRLNFKGKKFDTLYKIVELEVKDKERNGEEEKNRQ
ncbi:hypothetical protein CsSME_00043371 [Camellia sinensis var. sinensis]